MYVGELLSTVLLSKNWLWAIEVMLSSIKLIIESHQFYLQFNVCFELFDWKSSHSKKIEPSSRFLLAEEN